MAELGRAALVVCLGLVVYAVVAGGAAAHLPPARLPASGRHPLAAPFRRARLAASARNALVAAFAAALVASAVLLTALLRHDFSFGYVADHTSRKLPTLYTLSAFWGGQEGSLLLWLLVLTGYGAAAVLLNRYATRDLVAWVVPVVGGVAVFFAFLLVFVASPFATQLA